MEKAGVGIIIRDHKGEAILATSLLENNINNLKAIESLAIFRGLNCVYINGYQIFIKSDSQLVVNELLQQEASSSAIGSVLINIK